jgi:hypothetical protein
VTYRVLKRIAFGLLISFVYISVNLTAAPLESNSQETHDQSQSTPKSSQLNVIEIKKNLMSSNNSKNIELKSDVNSADELNTNQGQGQGQGLDESFLIYLGEIQEIKNELVDPIALNEGLAKNKSVNQTPFVPLVSENIVKKQSCLNDCENETEPKRQKDKQREINYEN